MLTTGTTVAFTLHRLWYFLIILRVILTKWKQPGVAFIWYYYIYTMTLFLLCYVHLVAQFVRLYLEVPQNFRLVCWQSCTVLLCAGLKCFFLPSLCLCTRQRWSLLFLMQHQSGTVCPLMAGWGKWQTHTHTHCSKEYLPEFAPIICWLFHFSHGSHLFQQRVNS